MIPPPLPQDEQELLIPPTEPCESQPQSQPHEVSQLLLFWNLAFKRSRQLGLLSVHEEAQESQLETAPQPHEVSQLLLFWNLAFKRSRQLGLLSQHEEAQESEQSPDELEEPQPQSPPQEPPIM